jgi:hypothetical protein
VFTKGRFIFNEVLTLNEIVDEPRIEKYGNTVENGLSKGLDLDFLSAVLHIKGFESRYVHRIMQ